MKIRELLQTELWSKRTSRKILIVSGIVTALLLLVYGVGYERNRRLEEKTSALMTDQRMHLRSTLDQILD
jgi:hypothetical protein